MMAWTSWGVSPCRPARWCTSFEYSKCGSLMTRSTNALIFGSTGEPFAGSATALLFGFCTRLGFEEFPNFLLVELLHGERRSGTLGLQLLEHFGEGVFHFGNLDAHGNVRNGIRRGTHGGK